MTSPGDALGGKEAEDPVYEQLTRAAHEHQAGKLAVAEALYRDVLAREPRHPDANHNLAILLIQQGAAVREALPLFEAAWDADPTQAHYGVSLLRALVRTGDNEKALRVQAEAQRRGLALPDPAVFAPAQQRAPAPALPAEKQRELTLALRAAAQQGAGKLHDVAKSVVAQHPGFGPAWGALASALEQLGDAPGALRSARQALVLGERDKPTALIAARVELSSGLYKEALRTYTACSKLWPTDDDVWLGLSQALLRSLDASGAESAARRVVQRNPRSALAKQCLGLALLAQSRPAEARAALESALDVDPTLHEAFSVLGRILFEAGDADALEALCRKALAGNASNFNALYTLGTLLVGQGRLQEAESCYRDLCRRNPSHLTPRSSLLFMLNYVEEGTAEGRLAEALAFGEAATAGAREPLPPWRGSTTPQKLRVGLMSGDLRAHPVSYFLQSVLESAPSAEIEWVAYASGPYEDPTTDRLKKVVGEWRNVNGLSDHECAKLVRADGLHVLLDLSGHTAYNRLPVFAWRPAPVQASWLGYFATTGLREMDFFIADAEGLPAELEGQFVERIWRLPTRLCFTPPDGAPPPAQRPAAAPGAVTFGCIQAHAKINDSVLRLWSKVLARCPQSTLRLQNDHLDNPSRRKAFQDRLAAVGLARDRVELVGAAPRLNYLSGLSQIDILLDTFPYPGGTTTCEALWMGVPTITLAGRTLLGRQGASLLAAAGLPDWIAYSEDEYVELALAKASQTTALAALRAQLRATLPQTPLFDASIFARHLVDALQSMWNQTREAPRQA